MQLPSIMWQNSPIQHTRTKTEITGLWNIYSRTFFFLKGRNLRVFNIPVPIWGSVGIYNRLANSIWGVCSSLISPPREAFASTSHSQRPPVPSTLASPVEKPEELTPEDKKSQGEGRN